MYKILVADDEPDVLSLLKDYFEVNGYEVITAKNGREAVEKMKKNPDMILLDVSMPDGDGLSVCRQVRDYVSCPILFLTSERLMASIPFAGRFRMIDFVLSSMVNCGIDNITVLVRENYFSLLDHLGSGREWDLSRKNGGLNIFPPFAQKNMGVYNETSIKFISHFIPHILLSPT